MYAEGDTQWLMYPVGDGGGEEDLCHVRSGGHSLTYVPSGGWERKGGSLPCTQWGMLSDTCTQWGMGEERRISASVPCMGRRRGSLPVGDTQWLMYPVGDGGGEEDLCHVRSGGHSLTYVPSGGWERKGGSLPCTQWGMLSDTCTQWGMGEERRISAMYAVGDAQWLMYPVGDGGGEEDLCHVRSGGRSVADVPSGGWGRRGGSVSCTQWGTLTHIPSGGWERKGGSLPCTQWGMLSDTCTQWGMGEERRISAMYAVGDAQWLMYPVGDGGGEEDLCHVRSGGRSVADVPSGGWGRRGGSLSCTQWGTLSG